MVNRRGDLKVSDFGIARTLADSITTLTREQGKSGTLVYMSPQQLAGQRASHLDDIYSVGATIYELLSGKPPFYSGDVTDQIKHVTPISMQQGRADLGLTGGGAIREAWEKVVATCLS